MADTWGQILERSGDRALTLPAGQRQEIAFLFLEAAFEQAAIRTTSPDGAFLSTPAEASFQHALANVREGLAIDQFHMAVSTLQWSVRQYLVNAEITAGEALALYEAVNLILDAVMRETTQEWAFQQYEVRKLKDELEGLFRIASHATAETDLNGVLRTVVLEIAELLTADFVAVLLPPDEMEWILPSGRDVPQDEKRAIRSLEIMAMVASDETKALLDHMPFTLDEGGALARAYLTGEAVSSSAPVDDLHVTVRRRQTLETLGFRHLVAAPIKMFNRVLGVACVANKDDHKRFGTEAIHLLTTVCAQAAAAIRNKQLFAKNKALSMDLVFTLTQALDARDSYTHNHSSNVAALARRIAQTMGLSAEQAEDIYIAGLLHDIGKIGIADSVLHKPGSLNRAERQLMMQHPVKSAQILQPVRGMQHLIPAVRHHHERWDGNGYPDCLTGLQIPFGGRILAMADAYDVMNNHRVYRRRRTPEDILKEIKAMSAKQFDPEVVEVLLHLAQEDGIDALTPKTGAVVPEPGEYYPDGDDPTHGHYACGELVAVAGLLDNFSRIYNIPLRLLDAEDRNVAQGEAASPEPPRQDEQLLVVKVGERAVGKVVAPAGVEAAMLEDLTGTLQEILGRHDVLESQVRQFSDLADLVRQLNACATAEEVLPATVEAAKRLLGVDAATFWIAEDERHLRFAASCGRTQIPWNYRVSLGHDDGLEGYVAYRKIPVATVDYLGEDRFAVPVWIRESGLMSAIAVPIMMGMRLVGVLTAMMYETTSFANEDTAILSAIANAAAAAYENAALRQRFHSAESTDPVTNLFNHRAFHERLAAEIDRACHQSGGLAVILFDVDHFAAYNDRHGFSAGDDLLRQVGSIARAALDGDELAARFGGEEFAVLIPAPDAALAHARACRLAETLREAVESATFSARNHMTARATISVGVVCFPDRVDNADQLIAAAHDALAKAKGAGRNCVFGHRASA